MLRADGYGRFGPSVSALNGFMSVNAPFEHFWGSAICHHGSYQNSSVPLLAENFSESVLGLLRVKQRKKKPPGHREACDRDGPVSVPLFAVQGSIAIFV
jgi:hypothetical protein